MMPLYPVYVISKGRWESRMTSRSLERMGVPYHLVVEPQEFDRYAAVVDERKIYRLPFSNLGQGSIPARNWCWEHAVEDCKAERHWVLDDNIYGFFRLNHNLRIPVRTGSTFRAAEAFVDRYENVALAGFQYFMFAPSRVETSPITLNTRIYSCILIKNDLPFRWRGRYNEDTDLSIRALKAGGATVLFNAFLCHKMATMTMKGGNTDDLYAADGRRRMAESLREQHPDVVTIVEKWGRWQHQVDYSPFAANELRPRPNVVVPDGVDNFGMELLIDGEVAIGSAPDSEKVRSSIRRETAKTDGRITVKQWCDLLNCGRSPDAVDKIIAGRFGCKTRELKREDFDAAIAAVRETA